MHSPVEGEERGVGKARERERSWRVPGGGGGVYSLVTLSSRSI